MTSEQIAASMAEALGTIADMPVVDPAIGLTADQIAYQYHEALQIARDAVKAYVCWTN